MKLMIYKNGLCDPGKNIGVAREFSNTREGAKSLDEYMKMFTASLDPKYKSNYRMFVVNDDVSFTDVDHYVLFDEEYSLGSQLGIKEINMNDVSQEVKGALKKKSKRQETIEEKVHEDVEITVETPSHYPGVLIPLVSGIDKLDFDNITATITLSDKEKAPKSLDLEA